MKTTKLVLFISLLASSNVCMAYDRWEGSENGHRHQFRGAQVATKASGRVAQCFVLNQSTSTAQTSQQSLAPPLDTSKAPAKPGASTPSFSPAPVMSPTPTASTTPAYSPTVYASAPSYVPTPVPASPMPGNVTSTSDGKKAGTSTISTGNYLFVIKTEPNNDGTLAADTYQLDANGLVIKQVGHAEVSEAQQQLASSQQSSSSQQQDSTSSFDASSAGKSTSFASFSSTADSPFPFQLSISSDTDNLGRSSGTLTVDQLFTRDSLSGVDVLCRLM